MVSLPGQPGPGIDTWDQPLIDAWFTPGFTAQNKDQLVAPTNGITSVGWPVDVTYVNIQHRFTDFGNGNPFAGFLTFWPSDSCTFTESGTTWSMARRPCGVTPWIPYGNSWNMSYADSGYIFLRVGVLDVFLVATDATGLATSTGNALTYHVREHWLGGTQYDITAPGASADPVDLYSLMVSGSQQPYAYDPRQPLAISEVEPDAGTDNPGLSEQTIVFGSTEYITINVSVQFPGLGISSPIADAVYIAVLTDPTAYPQSGDWNQAVWLTESSPFMAGLLEGPGAQAVIDLAVGTYYVWLKLVDDPEVPIIRAGTLNIS